MEYKERLKLIIKEWFYYKTAMTVNDDKLNVLVGRIAETKQCIIADVGNCAYLVQDKNTLINHGLFSSEEKAKKYINGSTKYAIQKCDIA